MIADYGGSDLIVLVRPSFAHGRKTAFVSSEKSERLQAFPEVLNL